MWSFKIKLYFCMKLYLFPEPITYNKVYLRFPFVTPDSVSLARQLYMYSILQMPSDKGFACSPYTNTIVFRLEVWNTTAMYG